MTNLVYSAHDIAFDYATGLGQLTIAPGVLVRGISYTLVLIAPDGKKTLCERTSTSLKLHAFRRTNAELELRVPRFLAALAL